MNARYVASVLSLLRIARTSASARSRQMILDSRYSIDTKGADAVRRLVMASDDDALFVGACVACILALADSDAHGRVVDTGKPSAYAVRRLVMASDDDALFVGTCVACILALADSDAHGRVVDTGKPSA